MWILDGDLYHKGLLKFAVSPESLKDSLVVLVADMSRPWTIMESLQKWASVLRDHQDKLKIPPEEMREMEQSSKCFGDFNVFSTCRAQSSQTACRVQDGPGEELCCVCVQNGTVVDYDLFNFFCSLCIIII